MPFRVIKFCKHSPGGLTVISNLFLRLPPSFPPPSRSLSYWHSLFLLFPASQHLLTLHVTTSGLEQSPESLGLGTLKCLSFSLYKPYHQIPPFDFLVSLFASIPFIPLFCYHLSLCFSLIYSVHGNSRVWSCCFGALVHWWISATLNSIQLLQTCPWILFSLCPLFFISSHCTSILLLAFPHVQICHNLHTPQPFYLSPFWGGRCLIYHLCILLFPPFHLFSSTLQMLNVTCLLITHAFRGWTRRNFLKEKNNNGV